MTYNSVFLFIWFILPFFFTCLLFFRFCFIRSDADISVLFVGLLAGLDGGGYVAEASNEWSLMNMRLFHSNVVPLPCYTQPLLPEGRTTPFSVELERADLPTGYMVFDSNT